MSGLVTVCIWLSNHGTHCCTYSATYYSVSCVHSN